MKQTFIIPKHNQDQLEFILDSQSKINQTQTLNFIDSLAVKHEERDGEFIHLSNESIVKYQSQRWYKTELKKLIEAKLVLVNNSYKVGKSSKSYKINDLTGFTTLITDINEKVFVKSFMNDFTITTENTEIHTQFIKNLEFPRVDSVITESDTLKDIISKRNIERMKTQFNLTIKRHRLYSPFTLLPKEYKQQFGIEEVDIKSCQPQTLEYFFDDTIPQEEADRYRTTLHNDIYTSLITNEDRDKLKKDMMKLFNSKSSSVTIQDKETGNYVWQPLYYAFKAQFPNILKLIRTIKKTNSIYDAQIEIEKKIIQDTCKELAEQDMIVGSNHDAIYCKPEYKSKVRETMVRRMKELGLQGLVG